MRADRLVATLLILQMRGKVTAAEVAAELEVSERTARRDLEALGMAGLPIYSTQGKGGGWRLAGGGRTDLSGLSAAETRALFLVVGPAAEATPELRAALRKLVRALPEPFRQMAVSAAGAVVVDRVGWSHRGESPEAPVHLDALQRAVVEAERVTLSYVDRTHAATIRVVHPLGLAAKGLVWYLVAGTDAGLRTFRVDRVTAVAPTGQPVIRPAGFDLDEAWKLVTEEVDQRRAPLVAHALAAPDVVAICRYVVGTRLRIGPAQADGRVAIELRGQSAWALAGELAGIGARLEFLDPPEVRDCLAAIGAELVACYRSAAGTEL